MVNTVELQATDMFEELDDEELTTVVGGRKHRPVKNATEFASNGARPLVQRGDLTNDATINISRTADNAIDNVLKGGIIGG